MYQRNGEVMVFDITHILNQLNEHPSGWLKKTRNTERRLAEYRRMEPNHDWAESLIDDYLCYTINSFQAVWVNGFNSNSMSSSEIEWFRLNEKATQDLWLMLCNLSKRFAGEMVGYARYDNLLILHVPTD